jgi:hypothetical protein
MRKKIKSEIARIYCSECGLKMCEGVDRALHRAGAGREGHVRIPYRPCRWGVVDPTSILSGVNQGLNVAAYEMVGGLYDLFAKPVLGAAAGGVTGAVRGGRREHHHHCHHHHHHHHHACLLVLVSACLLVFVPLLCLLHYVCAMVVCATVSCCM